MGRPRGPRVGGPDQGSRNFCWLVSRSVIIRRWCVDEWRRGKPGIGKPFQGYCSAPEVRHWGPKWVRAARNE